MNSTGSTQRMTIHQFHYCASAGDAISNQMFFIQESLREVGISGEIFAKEIKNLPANKARAFQTSEIWDCDLLLIHHSQGNPSLDEVLRIEVPKAVVYHNITPKEFFRHDPYIAQLCDLGRKQLSKFRNSVIASFADSFFNASELANLGFPPTETLPLYDLETRIKKMASRNTTKRKAGHQLLFVGKITAHKNQSLLIQSLFYLRHFHEQPWRLVLIGGEDPVYGNYLRLLCRALGLQKQVDFVGKCSDEELEAHYKSSDAFVCVSSHEGYCIPLVEAMVAGLPVFSIPTTAVRETMGGAGLELRTQRAHEIAEVIAAVWSEPAVLERALQTQSQRLEELKKVQSKERVQELCFNLVQKVRLPPLKREEGKFTETFF